MSVGVGSALWLFDVLEDIAEFAKLNGLEALSADILRIEAEYKEVIYESVSQSQTNTVRETTNIV